MDVHIGSKENKVDYALIVFMMYQLREGLPLEEVKQKCANRFSQMEDNIITETVNTALTMSKRAAVV